MNTDQVSIGAILASVALLSGIVALHLWSYYCKSRTRRTQYLLIVITLIIGALFIPISDGGGHTGPVRLWDAYKLLGTPEFYYANNRNFTIDSLVFAIPIMQNLISALLASLAVRSLPIGP